MIPGIFICIDNKTTDSYLFIFQYIKNYIIKIINNKKIKIAWETLTTDKEIALYKSFLKIFDINFCDYKHILCYFHFMENIRRFCQKNSYTTKEKKDKYDIIIDFTKNLPFQKNIKKQINKIFNHFKNNNNDLKDFHKYFEHEWINDFRAGKLSYENIYSKIRSNNCLENFNRRFKYMPNMKRNTIGILFIDNIIEETYTHISLLEEEMKKNPKKISENKKYTHFLEKTFVLKTSYIFEKYI